MPIIICKKCESRNTEGGKCIICGYGLGDPKKAFLAALLSSLGIGCIWVLLSLVGFQISWVAALYGGLVSGAVAHYSGGRGIYYQFVATAFTIAGILVFNSIAIWIFWPELAVYWQLPSTARPPFWMLVAAVAKYEPLTGALCAIGVFGGLWLFK